MTDKTDTGVVFLGTEVFPGRVVLTALPAGKGLRVLVNSKTRDSGSLEFDLPWPVVNNLIREAGSMMCAETARVIGQLSSTYTRLAEYRTEDES